MAIYTYSCPDCSGETIVNFSDRIFGQNLTWFASHQCSQCSYALEEDGFGKLPDSLRNLVLNQEGIWGIHLQESFKTIKTNSIKLKVIRQALDLTLSELRYLLHQSPDILSIGTKNEADFILLLLDKNGIKAEVQQIENSSLDNK